MKSKKVEACSRKQCRNQAKHIRELEQINRVTYDNYKLLNKEVNELREFKDHYSDPKFRIAQLREQAMRSLGQVAEAISRVAGEW